MDCPMSDGVLRVRVRVALASYLLRQWLVDCSLDHSLQGAEYRLWLRIPQSCTAFLTLIQRRGTLGQLIDIEGG
jgi:hypothetical protein